MLHKRVRIFFRHMPDFHEAKLFTSRHRETVLRTSWWLLWAIPLYVSDQIVESNLGANP